MTDWTTIPNTSLETGKPIRAVDGRALRDNPIAISEGATGAPRIKLPALEQPSAGATVRLAYDPVISGAVTNYTAIAMRFIQTGTIRASIDLIEPASVTSYAYFRRIRDNVTTTLFTAAHTASTWGTYTYDFSFLPNDILTIEVTLPASSQQSRNARFMTAGENLWPVDYLPTTTRAVLTNAYT